ncbi:MAG: cobalamin-binding protein [Bacillota bacterium]|nr:cobalamin-binding protein [Bacillota bacterium]
MTRRKSSPNLHPNAHRGGTGPRLLVLLLAAVMAVSVAAGCAGKKPEAGPAQPAPFPLTITDGTGRQVTVPAQPQRIISLAPSCTETVFALGLGSKVVGVDKFSNYPPEAQTLEKVGGFSDPSVEKIAALKPELILGTSMHKKVLPQLEALGIPVVLLDPKDVDGVLADIQTVGRLTGATEAAGKLASDVRNRITRVKDKIDASVPGDQRPWVYYEVYSEPIMTVGPHTLIHQLIELAGGRNIAYDAQTDYPEFSSEAVIQRNPAVIIFPSFHGSASLTVDKLKARPGWAAIAAVKNGRVHAIDADIISRPGPRIADAVEELARIIHPDLFPR